MPPSTWMQAWALRTAPSKATAPATSAAKAHWSSSVRATDAASQAAAVTASAVSSISAHRCLIAWKLPILAPNCSRTPAYSTAVSRHHRATPEASAAARVTAARRSIASSSPGTGSASSTARSTETDPNRRVRSRPTGRVPEDDPWVGVGHTTRSAGTTNHASAPGRIPAAEQQVGGAGGVPDHVDGAGQAFTHQQGRREAEAHPGAAGHRTAAAPDSGSTTDAMAVASNGPGTSPWAHASRATARSSTVPPPPPTDSGRPIVATPISPTADHASSNVADGSFSAARAISGPPSDAAHLRRLAASSACSSEIPKPTPSDTATSTSLTRPNLSGGSA